MGQLDGKVAIDTWDNVIQKMSDEQWYAVLDIHLSGQTLVVTGGL